VKTILTFWRSTLGKKVVMGVTGLVMIGFVGLHMLGNLQAFLGSEKLNQYAALLHGPLHEVTLALRLVLLVSVALHVVAAVQLTRLDRAARPIGYTRRESQASTAAARSLRVGGVLLLVFIVYHLLHFTTGQVHPDFVPGDVYHNLISGLRRPLVTGFYLIAMAALGLHLYHGAWSSFRSLGAVQPRANPLYRPVAAVVALVIWLGFSVVPVAVTFGWLR